MWHDVRLAIRGLRKTPVFTGVALLTLTLAIGANTAIFSLLNALMLRELPVRSPETLVQLSTLAPGATYEGGLTFPMYRAVQARTDLFSAVVGWWPISVVTIETDRERTRAARMMVSADFLAELGARPAAGRFLTPGDVDEAGWQPARAAVIGYGFWQRHYSKDASAIGRVVRVEGEPFTIVGVAPQGFRGLVFEIEPDVMLPLTALPLVSESKTATLQTSSSWVRTTVRLRSGVTIAQARAALDAWWPSLERQTAPSQYSGAQRDRFLATRLVVASAARGVEPGREKYSRPLVIVFAIAALILAIACANLASLMVSRAAARTREIGVRLALGAGRWRIVRQMLVEGLLLSSAGAACGIVFAYWASSAVVKILYQDYLVHASLDVAPDARLMAFTAAVAVMVGVLFSAAPAWLAGRLESTTLVQPGGRSVSGTSRTGKLLVGVQIALSLMLLTNAGLLVRSLREIRAVDSGMRGEHVFIAYPNPRPGGYTGLDNDAYYPSLAERIAAIPGVQRAALALNMPAGGSSGDGVRVSRSDQPPEAKSLSSVSIAASPGLFDTLGVRLRAGRDFAWSDNSRGRAVTIVSETLARRLFGGAAVIGRHLRVGLSPSRQDVEIVGVAADARLYDLKDPNLSTVYVPALQEPSNSWKCIVVRGAAGSIDDLRRTVASFGHEDVMEVETLEYITDRALLRERGTAMLATFFGGLALVLAGIGLYGLMSYNVAQRRREIGIRVALGAEPLRVVRGVVGDGLAVTLTGAAAGFAAALASVALVKSLLFGVTAHDPVTLAAAPLVLVLVATLASLLPAIRAARTDPMVVLRAE